MKLQRKIILNFVLIPLLVFHLSSCQVVTGTAVKVATVSQEERSMVSSWMMPL